MTARRKIIIVCIGVMVLMGIVNSMIMRSIFSAGNVLEVSYDEFLRELENKNVDRVQVEDNAIYYTLKEENRTTEVEETDFAR